MNTNEAVGPTPDEESPPSFGLDSLYDQSVDMGAVEQAEADALLPAGSYQSVPTLAVNVFEAQTGPNKGRHGFRFFGAIRSRKPLSRNDGRMPQEVSGRVQFQLSPERRNKEDGTPDHQYKLWMNAVRAFKISAGYPPESNRSVVEYLQNYPVGLRLGQVGVPTERNPDPEGDPGNIVFSIFPLRDA